MDAHERLYHECASHRERHNAFGVITASRGVVITYSVDLSVGMLQIMDAVNLTATSASTLNMHEIANDLRALVELIRTNYQSSHRWPIHTVIESVEHVICTKCDGISRGLFAHFAEIVKSCRS